RAGRGLLRTTRTAHGDRRRRRDRGDRRSRAGRAAGASTRQHVTLRSFFAVLLGICRFRRGPEDLPYSPPLLIALLIACGALQGYFNIYNGAAPGVAVAVLVGGVALIGALYLLLRGRGKALRFVQTMTALAAVYLLFGVAIDALISGLSLAALSKQVIEHPDHPPTLTTLQTLVIPGVV